jgi:hypothetical protein
MVHAQDDTKLGMELNWQLEGSHVPSPDIVSLSKALNPLRIALHLGLLHCRVLGKAEDTFPV